MSRSQAEFSGPAWVDGKKINEALFCEEYLRQHPMICVHSTFFTTEGRVSDESGLKKDILNQISPYTTSGLARRVDNVLDVMRVMCSTDQLPAETDRIHLANGTLLLNGSFDPEKKFCLNRLPVRYNPDAPEPARWLSFLRDLLEAEDIPTLQEYMGYCLIPSTKGQRMLIITGRGGEGKSRIGLVLRALLGENMNTGSIAKVETNPFARADLEHQLLLVDDDLKLESLPQTNNIKSIVTAELPMDLEKKGKQSYQGRLYTRFLCLGNGTLKAQNDRSVGFFRRQIILTVRERDTNREDDPFIGETMCGEAEGILLWALDGLRRLIANSYHFTISDRAKENMRAAVTDGNNVIDFLQSDGYIIFRADSATCTKHLYQAYRQWCDDNALTPLTQKEFSANLKQNASDFCLEYTNHVPIGANKYARGYFGIETV